MARYSIETRYYGNNRSYTEKSWEGDKPIDVVRKRAASLSKEKGVHAVYIYSWTGGYLGYGEVKNLIATVVYDQGVVKINSHNKIQRISPKTGKLLDYDKYHKYL